jgi:hypothetical protein
MNASYDVQCMRQVTVHAAGEWKELSSCLSVSKKLTDRPLLVHGLSNDIDDAA